MIFEKMTRVRILRNVFLSSLTAVLLVLAFPNPQISILAWVAFIPLFFALDGTLTKKSFFLSYLCGIFFYGGLIYWLTYVTKLGYIILVLALAFFFGFFGLFTNLFISRLHSTKFVFLLFLVLPATWVSFEFLRGWLFTGFPWGILGYTQYRNYPLLQIADITGAYGISFVIVMVNFVLYASLSNFFRKSNRFRAIKFQIIASIIIIAACMLYGYYALGKDDVRTGIRLSVVQGNIAQEEKWDPEYKDYILTQYEILTKEAARDKGNLIIWPETPIPGYLDEEDINTRLKRLMRDTGIRLFSGTVTYEFGNEKDYFFNSAVLFSQNGDIEKKYDKLHLVPFGEYVPFERHLPFVRNFINTEIGDYTAGGDFTLFDIESKDGTHYKYAALICFEDIFPYLAQRFAHSGADFLINITNDAWFKESSGQMQHAQASVFRAVENRVSVVRAANTGFSCYINSKGTIEDAIYDKKTGGIYIAGFKTFELKVSKKHSLYTKYGDLFALACLLFLSAFLSFPLFLRRPAPL